MLTGPIGEETKGWVMQEAGMDIRIGLPGERAEKVFGSPWHFGADADVDLPFMKSAPTLKQAWSLSSAKKW
jgi:hypothetical protein